MADTSRVVKLDPASASDSPLLSNLLQLYIHDLSDVFPDVELGHDGRYGYDRLPLYWSEAHRRFAFLIRCDGRPAGFAFAQLWNLLPGKWTVRVLERNGNAVAFWRDVVAEYSKGTASESKLSAPPNTWRVFFFEATRSRVGP